MLLDGSTPPLKLGFGGAKFKAATVVGKVEWSAEVTTLFPWETKSGPGQGSITGRLFATDSVLGGLGLAATGFQIPIGKSGWNLNGLDGNVILQPRLAFDVGLTAEQQVKVAGTPFAKVTGNLRLFRLAAQDCRNGSNPLALVVSGDLPPLEVRKIGIAKLGLTMCAYLQGGARLLL